MERTIKSTRLKRPGLSLCVHAGVGDSPTAPRHGARLACRPGAGSPRAGSVPLVPGHARPRRGLESFIEGGEVRARGVAGAAPPGRGCTAADGRGARWHLGGVGFLFYFIFKN